MLKRATSGPTLGPSPGKIIYISKKCKKKNASTNQTCAVMHQTGLIKLLKKKIPQISPSNATIIQKVPALGPF
jgi:hypothetical protein